ncbi:MAG TPA: AraC family transcriptional regulator [Casimicrobiaceae bacterium]|nr:AraC family transcriptional regulator [Casimicrobiaceae bacterium]
MTPAAPVDRPVIPGIEVVREGRVEAFLHARPALSSAAIRWGGLAVEDYHVPDCVIAKHEHVHDFLHVVLSGNVRYEVLTGGKCLRYTSQPGTTFVLPRGTLDELRWSGPTHRIAVALHPSLLLTAIDEIVGQDHVELTEHWNVTDHHIMSVLLALTTDLDAGSPAGRLYGESLANALAVYLLSRYAVQRRLPTVPKGGLPRYRLKRVLDYIGDNLAEDVSLSDLAELAGMSAHHFAELFKRSMSCTPHRYVLHERIERAKIALRDPECTVLDAAAISGFPNPSHFARMFRRFVGISPSQFQSDQTSLLRITQRQATP